MHTVTIKPGRLRYSNVSFYRGNAEALGIGTYGTKKSLPLKADYLDPADTLSASALEALEVDVSGPFQVEWADNKKVSLDYGGPLRFLKADGKPASLTYNAASTANLELLRISCPFNRLKQAINESAPEALEFLWSDAKGRVVSTIWVAMEGTLAAEVQASASVSLTYQGHSVTLNYGSTSSSKVTLAAGTTFAYMLHQVSKWSGGSHTIASMKEDRA